MDIEKFALVPDEAEYQCFFVMCKMAVAKDEIAKRYDGLKLLGLYYQGLMNILDPDDKNSLNN